MTSPAEARAFARTCGEATLQGGSGPMAAQVAFTPEGRPIIATGQPLAGGRLRLVLRGGDGSQLSIDAEAGEPDASDETRLLAIHPDPAPHRRRLEPLEIEWLPAATEPVKIDAAQWLLPTPAWREGEAGINEHMNDDHVDAMQRMCRIYRSVEAEDPRLVAVDPEGLLMRAGDQLVHVAFDTPSYSNDDVHHATVRLAREARRIENERAGV